MPAMGEVSQADIDASILTHKNDPDAHHTDQAALEFIIDGAGSEITIGQKGHLEVPFACTITAWTIAADVSGAIKIDVWRDTYANFPPDNTDSLCGGHEPEIAASAQKAQDTDLGDWTSVALVAGDILAFNVDSCTTITRVTLSLTVTKS